MVTAVSLHEHEPTRYAQVSTIVVNGYFLSSGAEKGDLFYMIALGMNGAILVRCRITSPSISAYTEVSGSGCAQVMGIVILIVGAIVIGIVLNKQCPVGQDCDSKAFLFLMLTGIFCSLSGFIAGFGVMKVRFNCFILTELICYAKPDHVHVFMGCD